MSGGYTPAMRVSPAATRPTVQVVLRAVCGALNLPTSSRTANVRPRHTKKKKKKTPSDPHLTPTRANTRIIRPHAITTTRGEQARLPTPAHSELRSRPPFRVRGHYVRAYGELRVIPARSHAIPRRLACQPRIGDDARLSHFVIITKHSQ